MKFGVKKLNLSKPLFMEFKNSFLKKIHQYATITNHEDAEFYFSEKSTKN
tara:strand:+ start:3247 stop:3396 length:150 start_codon:yes stop_codon:yes gene_type:complete